MTVRVFATCNAACACVESVTHEARTCREGWIIQDMVSRLVLQMDGTWEHVKWTVEL